ncbi:MAG: 3-oxocholest-4-en-26-oyl-CoA dehydrogenase alpha subunit [Acidimicrobiaceae bacterium]|nr:3-oxocholest-4-en-26-oyl-CoA dehydrogenase alpha subunit [Acidimicrobiaceae bacterium]
MFLDQTPEQQALRKELREYFADLLTPDVRAALGDPGEGSDLFRSLVRRMGADGWLGIGWPKEYGGQGRPPTDQYIFFDEVQRASAPFPFVTLNTVGPTLMLYGSQEQKDRFLPGILRGEVNFAIGYTEPEAGTDLASLRTRAVRDGDEYVITGSKIFTSGANQADYIWLACRTDVDAPKHKGISMIIVPTDDPGFEWSPIMTVGGVMTTATFYDAVRVPVDNLVGAENEGWRMITTQLNHERVGLAALCGLAQRLSEETRTWARSTGRTGQPWVRTHLAEAHARLEAMRLLNWRMASRMTEGTLSPADSSAVKVFGTEGLVEVYRLLLEVVGPAGSVRAGWPGAALAGELERAARAAQINTFGGGVNEVQREIVASVGLGMARRAR